ncbi:hypothetical protein [Acetobacter fabarum]|uniref:hypothetical protein n=1 Tax=Acetobacter fabarum TaxID=483199 RepID=UPI00209C9B03|nr:hypothetical protein [Acetobacter fabarum]MCP1228951.1 hypothetical protein [Acetobacter fabarum]MCP1234446.1 hypothetical protein [Acetobacter fabarum]
MKRSAIDEEKPRNGEQLIGTIQCKHTSDAGKALKLSDLSAEIGNVEELVKGGQADTYIFMTNMSVDAPVAAAMRAKLREFGVRKPHMMAALIRGAPIDTILGSFTCEGSPLIRDALVIPSTLDEALVARLSHTPDENHRNWMLFHFLSYRANDAVFAKLIGQFPELLRRYCWQSDPLANDPRFHTYGRAHQFGLLPEDLRREAARSLESAALSDLDMSFFAERGMLALISPLRLVGLGLALRTKLLPALEEKIDEIAADADLDEEPDSHFKKLLDALERIEEMGVELDDDAVGLVGDARDQVNRAVDGLEERKRERDEDNEDDTDWTYIVTQKKEEPSPPELAATKRSVFDDGVGQRPWVRLVLEGTVAVKLEFGQHMGGGRGGVCGFEIVLCAGHGSVLRFWPRPSRPFRGREAADEGLAGTAQRAAGTQWRMAGRRLFCFAMQSADAVPRGGK